MTTIGLISDTHNHIDPKHLDFLSDCSVIWHAGDIGSVDLADRIASIKTMVAVHGNIDDYNTRLQYPEFQIFTVEGVKVMMTHIGGYPGRYAKGLSARFLEEKPDIFVCGHSHILRVMYDNKYNMLVMNPGAAGQYGQQPKRTALKFRISGKDIHDLEICELPR